MAVPGKRLSIKLLIGLLIVALAAMIAGCSADEAETTTARDGDTATTSAAASAAGKSVTTIERGSNDSSVSSSEGSASGNAGTQSSQQPPEPPQTPPSDAAGQTTPPQPGEEFAEKLPELQQAAKDAPDDLEALAELAIAYYQTQSYAQAEATYRKMIAIRDAAEFHNNLANVYRDWQKAEQAVAEYEKAIELEPAGALSYGNLAAMLMMNGKLGSAKEIAREGIEKTTGEGRAQLQRLLDSMS